MVATEVYVPDSLEENPMLVDWNGKGHCHVEIWMNFHENGSVDRAANDVLKCQCNSQSSLNLQHAQEVQDHPFQRSNPQIKVSDGRLYVVMRVGQLWHNLGDDEQIGSLLHCPPQYRFHQRK